MDLKAEARARLRDPWLHIALAIVLALPALVLVGYGAGAVSADRQPDMAYAFLVQLGLATVALFPLLALFLAGAAPEAGSKRDLLTRYLSDVVMIGAVLLVGWGLSVLLAVSLFGSDPAMLPVLAVFTVLGTLYFAAWRALGSAADAPGRPTGALLIRLFSFYLVLSVVLPRLLQEVEYRSNVFPSFRDPDPPSTWLVLAQFLTPGSAWRHLVATMFPASASGFMEGWFLVSWYTPWPFLAALLAWCGVPLWLALRRYPRAPPEPRGEPSATDAPQ